MRLRSSFVFTLLILGFTASLCAVPAKDIEAPTADQWSDLEKLGPGGTVGGARKPRSTQYKPINAYLEDKELAYVASAWRFEDHHQYGNGIPDADNALKLNPKDGIAYCVRARLKMKVNDFAGAVKDCQQAIKYTPEINSAHSIRGWALCVLGKYEEGAAELSKAIGTNHIDLFDQLDYYDYLNRAKAFERLGHKQEAERDLGMVEKLKNVNNAYMARSRIDLKSAAAFINKAVKEYPDRKFTHFLRGVICNNVGDYKSAIDEFNYLLKSDPQNPILLYFRADTYTHTEQMDKAIQDFTKIISLNPRIVALNFVAETGRCRNADYGYDENLVTPGDIYYLRGIAYADQKNLDKAISDISETIKRNHGDFEALQSRGELYKKKGDIASALKDCDAAIKIVPGNPEASVLKAGVYEQAGDFAKAINMCNDMLKIDPDGEGPLIFRARLYGKLGKTKEALADLDRAVKSSPHDEEILGLRANALFTAGQYQKAIDDYTNALRLSPRNTVTFLKLRAQAYQKLGDYKHADADLHAAAQKSDGTKKKN